MCIGKWVVVRVPPPEAQIKATDARSVVVNYYDFLVMRPELDVVLHGLIQSRKYSADCIYEQTFTANVVRVTHASDIGMQRFKCMFCVARAH